MKLAGGVSVTVVTFLATFYFTVWVGSPVLLVYYPPEWLILAIPTLFAVLTSMFVWTHSASTGGTLGRGQRLGTDVWAWYLITGAVLAAARVAMFVWVNHQQAKDIYTETNTFITRWFYPEGVVSLVWRSLAGNYGTKYDLAWCSLFAVGSFVMATPMLLVGWLRNRRTTS